MSTMHIQGAVLLLLLFVYWVPYLLPVVLTSHAVTYLLPC